MGVEVCIQCGQKYITGDGFGRCVPCANTNYEKWLEANPKMAKDIKEVGGPLKLFEIMCRQNPELMHEHAQIVAGFADNRGLE